MHEKVCKNKKSFYYVFIEKSLYIRIKYLCTNRVSSALPINNIFLPVFVITKLVDITYSKFRPKDFTAHAQMKQLPYIFFCAAYHVTSTRTVQNKINPK